MDGFLPVKLKKSQGAFKIEGGEGANWLLRCGRYFSHATQKTRKAPKTPEKRAKMTKTVKNIQKIAFMYSWLDEI